MRGDSARRTREMMDHLLEVLESEGAEPSEETVHEIEQKRATRHPDKG